MAAVFPGVSDTGSGGTEAAMERGPVRRFHRTEVETGDSYNFGAPSDGDGCDR
jgi:hypothetical protein